MFNGFSGGLWLDLQKKPASERPIDVMPAPKRLFVPIGQHLGDLPELAVSVGSRVKMGEPLAVSNTGSSCNVHSPVSGRVIDIKELTHPVCGKSPVIIIENNGKDQPYEGSFVKRDVLKASKEEVIPAARRAGILSTGSADVPFWLRLQLMADKKVHTVVINAVETEPYVCTSEKLLSENPDQVARAMLLVLKSTGAKKAILAVSDDVARGITDDFAESMHLLGVELKVLRVRQKYPSGYSRLLMRQIEQQKLQPGEIPEDIGYGFVYTEELYELYRAVTESRPQITRVVTVAGTAVQEPQNLEVPIGTPVKDILDHCELNLEPERIVLGSIMRGVAIDDTELPVIKTVNAVLALSAKKGAAIRPSCINCGRCVRVCPQRLMPNYIAMLAIKADFEACSKLHIGECIECGSCAYICPGRMPLVELIKNIKKAAR